MVTLIFVSKALATRWRSEMDGFAFIPSSREMTAWPVPTFSANFLRHLLFDPGADDLPRDLKLRLKFCILTSIVRILHPPLMQALRANK